MNELKMIGCEGIAVGCRRVRAGGVSEGDARLSEKVWTLHRHIF